MFADQGYDHVVYDSPPVLSVSDPVIIANLMDAVVLVVRANRTPRESVRLAAETLSQAGVRPVGAVVNDLDTQVHGHSALRYYGRSYRYTQHADDPGAGDRAARDDERRTARGI